MAITNKREFSTQAIMVAEMAKGLVQTLEKAVNDGVLEIAQMPNVKVFEELKTFAENEIVKMDKANERRKNAPPSPKQAEKLAESRKIAEQAIALLQNTPIDLTAPETWNDRLLAKVAEEIGVSSPKLAGVFRSSENEGKVIFQKSEVKGFKSSKVMLLPEEVEPEETEEETEEKTEEETE